jgi:hypothetical protein
MVGNNMEVNEYYGEGYELGLDYDFGPQVPVPPPLDPSDPTDAEALSLWFNGFNQGVQVNLAKKGGVRQDPPKTAQVDSYLKDIVYSLARFVRGTDCVYPSTKGIQIGQLLVKLRILDGTEYDKRVIQKKS